MHRYDLTANTRYGDRWSLCKTFPLGVIRINAFYSQSKTNLRTGLSIIIVQVIRKDGVNLVRLSIIVRKYRGRRQCSFEWRIRLVEPLGMINPDLCSLLDNAHIRARRISWFYLTSDPTSTCMYHTSHLFKKRIQTFNRL